jgi:NAD(P)-dependent dehydrogenase (short-subunit alcohol dehydrogenase family)
MTGDAFTGKVVVVTGAARGLGHAIAQRFAEEGATVVLADLDGEAANQAARALDLECGSSASAATPVELAHSRVAHSRIQPAQLDVRDPAACRGLADAVAAEHGKIDVWVNNAGVWHRAPAETMPAAMWEDSLAVMLSGAFYGSQAAAAHMLPAGRGVIINISSVEAYQIVEGHVAYSVAKAGLLQLTEALGVEWAGRGVRVVGVAPGVLATGWLERDAAWGAALAQTYERRTPMHRLGQPEEVAEAVLYLASDEASYITAETLPVDGGWIAYQLF